MMVMHGFGLDFYNNSDNIFLNNEVAVIDFGFATRYLQKKTDLHVQDKVLSKFRGNFQNASIY